jgi:hypothetical protein
MLRSPWNIFLNTAMFAANDLPQTVYHKHLSSADRNIPPYSRLVENPEDFTAAVTFGTTGTIFMGLDFKPELFTPVIESKINDTISFDF